MSNLKVLFLSHTPDTGVFKVGSHHYARELSKRSIAVAHVSTPRSLIHMLRGHTDIASFMSKGLNVSSDIYGTVHAVPSVLAPIQLLSAGRALHKIVSAIGFDDADFIVIDQPLMSGYVAAGNPRGKIIYRPTDTYNSWPANRRQEQLNEVCDAVIATSSAVLERLNVRQPKPCLVIENGVELQRFTPLSEDVRTGFVYVGAVDYRFDWDSVISVAAANPAETVTIVGPVTVKPSSVPENVKICGAVSYDEIPGILHRSRVGLIPLNSSDVNQGRSPMKYYEYLASGLSVLATSTRALRERSSAQTFLYEGLHDVAMLSHSALAADAPNITGMREAAAQDWSAKADLMLAFLQDL